MNQLKAMTFEEQQGLSQASARLLPRTITLQQLYDFVARLHGMDIEGPRELTRICSDFLFTKPVDEREVFLQHAMRNARPAVVVRAEDAEKLEAPKGKVTFLCTEGTGKSAKPPFKVEVMASCDLSSVVEEMKKPVSVLVGGGMTGAEVRPFTPLGVGASSEVAPLDRDYAEKALLTALGIPKEAFVGVMSLPPFASPNDTPYEPSPEELKQRFEEPLLEVNKKLDSALENLRASNDKVAAVNASLKGAQKNAE